jgi:hypothetical protein
MAQIRLSIPLASPRPETLRLRPQALGAFFVPKQNLKFNPAKFPVLLNLSQSYYYRDYSKKLPPANARPHQQITPITFLDFKTLLKQTLHPPKQAYE